ncbi:hypothetical protein GCM10007103_20260 [Salinimicrobium marinum]|uniref:Holin-X, holin superfamily III n=1 Tax=Salinimicrobium marinum TaxID=680283 RepID=A0A918SEL6_9FLAO|nr:phage holin family protein [Salinimicrobium marinum]GHA38825.1 hypothetical protein GCM10007103_20260 [Salinimicrobium marinum]
MAFERISANLERLNQNIKAFSKSSAEYYKLDLFEKVMKGATSLARILVIGFLALFFLLFLSLAASVWISDAIGNASSGFFIVAGFYLLLILFMKFFGSSMIEETMLIKVSRKFFNSGGSDKGSNEDKRD